MKTLSAVAGIALLACSLLIPAVNARAANIQSAAPIANKPASIPMRNTSVAVEFQGTDSIGSRLASRVKENFNTSTLFTLTEKDTPKLRLLISTVPEFPTRPEVGSACSVIWLFSRNNSDLRHFLKCETHVVGSGDVDNLAAKILETTDGVSTRYDYLFQ